MRAAHFARKDKAATANNNKLVDDMVTALDSSGTFKFDSFNAHHNALFNGRLFAGNRKPIKPAPAEAPKKKAAGTAEGTQSLNQILFGPPGTGKTYATIAKALTILGESVQGMERVQQKAMFEHYVCNGQVVFCTFHQSFGYEDFIEGIKPVVPEKEGDPVVYRVEHGVFRRICLDASFSIAASKNSHVALQMSKFSHAYKQLLDTVDESQTQGNKVVLPLRARGSVTVDGVSAHGNIQVKHEGKEETHTVSRERLARLWLAIPELGSVGNVRDAFEAAIGGSNTSAYWAVLNRLRQQTPAKEKRGEHQYTWAEKQQIVEALTHDDYVAEAAKRYVLIIDEINRGNVSQVFGELITLLEDDKRLGRAESLQVELPYSKERFGVPPNLYVVGTMNTADRSVEALDTALRRRFVFEEKRPDPSQLSDLAPVEGYSLQKLLILLNRRMELLLGHEHLIGHSYFIGVDSLDALKHSFCRKIIPLLREYFYGDYGKIGLVVGSGFIRIKHAGTKNAVPFAVFNYDSDDLADVTVHEIIPEADVTMLSALALLGPADLLKA